MLALTFLTTVAYISTRFAPWMRPTQVYYCSTVFVFAALLFLLGKRKIWHVCVSPAVFEVD
jgi:hypothetical protein